MEFDLERYTNPLAFKEDPEANSGEKGTIYYVPFKTFTYGMDTKQQYDCMKFLASLQGLLNRDKPTLFVDFIEENNTDRFWFSYLRLKGKMLYGYKKELIRNFGELLDTFKDFIVEHGLVMWDENVPATANVAATICGVDGYLPVRNDTSERSIYSIIVTRIGAEVKLDLSGKFTGEGTIPDVNLPSSGSAKCDAYLWAVEKYLDKTNTTKMAYVLDGVSWSPDEFYYPDLNNAYVPNHDYIVSQKMFAFDLGVWDDEAPNDDPGQPLGTDLATLKTILQRQYDRTMGQEIIQISGFVPWLNKYTVYGGNGKHGEVETEWMYAEIVSAYNGVMDADAAGYCGMANASLYRLYPLKESYESNRPAERMTYDPNKRYVLHYLGDYDCAPWTLRLVPQWWNDPNRNSIPMNWAFNPNLSDRIPMVFDYIYETKLANDFFISGDSGAGYLNPSLLVADESREHSRIHSDNPTNMDTWVRHNQKYFQKFDLSIVGFLLNGNQPMVDEVYEAYSQFAPDGVIVSVLTGPEVKVVNDVVFGTMPIYLDNNVDSSANALKGMIELRASKGINFTAARSVICSPTYIKGVADKIHETNPEVEFVDAYNFFDLWKQSLEQ